MKCLVSAKNIENKHAANISASGKCTGVQPKLFVSQPNNKFEQEANRMADAATAGTQISFIQNKFSRAIESKNVTAKTSNSKGMFALQTKGEGSQSVPDDVSETIHSSQGRGMNLDDSTGSFMSRSFGADFSNVKVHTDNEAVQLNRQLNAQAFTVGSDIYFNEGKYAPDSEAGRHLLAHELTHTVQQGAAPVALQKEDKDDKTYTPKPEIDFKVLPPDLQLRLFHFLLEADTSKVHFDYETRSFMAGLSYSYGDALSLKMRFTDFTTKLGWKPGENTFSLGLSHGAFDASFKANPAQSKYGLNLTYGAPLLPMQDDMSKTFMAGGTSAGNMMRGLPGLPGDPMAWYQQYKPDIENITKSADLVKQITDAGKSKIRFGAGFSLTYDPVNELVIGARAGIMF